MEKYILIDNNKFLCDNFYLTNILPLANNRQYTKNSNIFEYRWINYPESFEKSEREFIKKYCTENSIVLELGGNVGITSCLINSITKYKYEHTVTENNNFLSQILQRHKILNNCNFKILSYHLDDINLLNNKYNYNTLISDIEGDEYQFIINNFDYIAKYIKLIIIEFHTIYFCKKKQLIDKVLIKKCHDILNTKFTVIDQSHTMGHIVVYKNNTDL